MWEMQLLRHLDLINATVLVTSGLNYRYPYPDYIPSWLLECVVPEPVERYPETETDSKCGILVSYWCEI